MSEFFPLPLGEGQGEGQGEGVTTLGDETSEEFEVLLPLPLGEGWGEGAKLSGQQPHSLVQREAQPRASRTNKKGRDRRRPSP